MLQSDQYHDEQILIRRIQRGEKEAFEKLFFTHYYPLCNYGAKITGCSEMARDAVQDVFLKIWKGREQWQIRQTIKAYLFRAVRNQSVKLVEAKYRYELSSDSQMESLHMKDLERLLSETKLELHSTNLATKVWAIAASMPDRRRQVFELHRRHGLSYQEIAEVLDITPKTVENHLARALQELRERLSASEPGNSSPGLKR